MRYIVSFAAGVLLILLFYGFLIASGSGEKSTPTAKVVFVQSITESNQLRLEIDRLRTVAAIREVLEVFYPSVSIEEKREVAETISEACEIYDLKAELVLAVIKTESAFNDSAISHKGALGLMQLLPLTGRAMADEINLDLPNGRSLFDRRTNILIGCYYLKKMLNRYERLDHALLAYNTGPSRLDRMLSTRTKMPGTYAELVHHNMRLLARNYFPQTAGSD